MDYKESKELSSVEISLELSRERNGFSIWLSDNFGGSGIKVLGQTPIETVNNLTPYIVDYFMSNLIKMSSSSMNLSNIQ